jgi:hypothetical protein
MTIKARITSLEQRQSAKPSDYSLKQVIAQQWGLNDVAGLPMPLLIIEALRAKHNRN